VKSRGKELKEDIDEVESVFYQRPPGGAPLVGGSGYSEGSIVRREVELFGRVSGHGERWNGEVHGWREPWGPTQPRKERNHITTTWEEPTGEETIGVWMRDRAS